LRPYDKREQRRLVKDKAKIPCITVGGSAGGGGFGGDPDELPGGWETLAGAEKEVRVLKELALLPLVYPEAFAALGVSPSRGVLLHGPPGTGKTAGCNSSPLFSSEREGERASDIWRERKRERERERERELLPLVYEGTRLSPWPPPCSAPVFSLEALDVSHLTPRRRSR